VLDLLDSPQDGKISPIAAFYWPQQALEIANVVASETCGILSAYGMTEKNQLVFDLAFKYLQITFSINFFPKSSLRM
jgi:hypothetical protein